MYVISGGGYGGSPAGDGISNGCSTIGISKTTPIEIMEQLYPVLFEEYSLHEGSGGAGEYRGGFGVNYRIRLRRGSATVSMVMDHGRVGPSGAQGGAAGGKNKVKVIRNGVAYLPPHLSKDQGIEIHAGDVIAVSTPGGGGFGPASARPAAAVERDLALGYYTAAEVEREFAGAAS
jgi:N-methylhydantoinase B